MTRGLKRLWGFLLALTLLMLSAVPAQGALQVTDAPESQGSSAEFAYVRFADAPLATYDGSTTGYAATKPGKGEKLNLNSPAAQKYGKKLEAQRQNYMKWLAKHYPQVEVVAQYSVTYNGLGVKLNGATPKQIQGGPGAVETGFANTYRKAMNTSRAVINAAPLAQALGGQENAGAGIKVGVIDSGIDQNHPFLQGTMEMPEGFPKGDPNFTTNKVIAAWVFNQSPWLTPEAVDSHGTHVAGTIAGKYGTSAPMAGGLSGVAPGAYLGNYNVFPGTVESASSLFIAKAVEQAVSDGMDVLNLSLGGGAHKGADLLEMTVNAAAEAGVVVAIAAGNEGPGNYTVGSPGTASDVITVAAVTNAHKFGGALAGGPIEPPGAFATTGDGNGELTEPLAGEYAVWADHAGGDSLACSPLASTDGLAGKIALIERGTCTFSTKVTNAAAAGAIAAVIYQSPAFADSDPIPMSTPGVSIPAVMINRASGLALVGWAGDRNISVSLPTEWADMANKMADFTSWGPTPNYTLKPDLAAVGVNVYSSVVGGEYAPYNGTSMATPHVAGSAALLLAYSAQAGLGWGPAEIKAALMGTAGPVVDTEDPLKVGAGLIDLGRAMNPPAMAFPSSLSFGLVRPVGNQTYAIDVRLLNSSGSAQTYSFAVPDELVASAESVTLEAGEEAVVTFTVVDRGAHQSGQAGTPDMRRGLIHIASDAGSVVLPYLYIIDYNR